MHNSANTAKRKPDRTCFVPGCTTGYKNNKSKITLFSTPKSEKQFEKWLKIIPRADKVLNQYSVVCEAHFDERFIERNYKYIIEGKEVLLPRTRPILTADAFPSIFPNLPKYFTKKLAPIRSPKIRNDTRPPPKKKSKFDCSSSSIPASDNVDSSNNVELTKVLDNVPLPSKWCKISKPQDNIFLYSFYDCLSLDAGIEKMMNILSTPSKLIVVSVKEQIFSCSIYVNFKLIKTLEANSSTEIEDILNYTENLIPCSGVGNITEFSTVKFYRNLDFKNDILRSKNCQGYVPCSLKSHSCIHCKSSRKRLLNIKSKCKAKTLKSKRLPNVKYIKKRNKQFINKVKLLKNEVKTSKKLNVKFHLELDKKIESLPKKQQLAITECFKAASRKSTNGMLYQKEWLLECIIMRMKSPRLYEHLRINKILILPSKSCLNTYTKTFSQGYGFNSTLLSILKEKVSTLDSFSIHGNLIFDELKLSENLQLKSDGTISGYVDYGMQTPEYLKSKVCDHGLLLVFVPFTGDWIQILGVFATNKNMKADILLKTLIEACIHAENAGLHVDCITGDGASWNRSMWSICGIGESSSGQINYKVKHPCGGNRSLYFISDFPHLVKCVRNAFLKNGFLTPMGDVRSEFLKAAWKEDSDIKIKLKVMPKITNVHFHPNSFEKMRVGYAFQLFSRDVVRGLSLYKDAAGLFGDPKPTTEFVKKMSSLITIMTSRCAKDALRMYSWQEQEIMEFHDFLSTWKKESGKDGNGFLSHSTYVGLQVTLLSCLSLSKYLMEDVGYKYLMTSRLSQDKIENLFGIVRAAKGCNDHPTPAEFLNIVDCLSFYNLARPVRGSNVEIDVINALIPPPNSQCFEINPLQSAIDSLIDCGQLTDAKRVLQCKIKEDISNKQLVFYISGYVVRKFLKNNNCSDCKTFLSTDAANITDSVKNYTKEFDKGGLIYASKPVFNLIQQLENCFTSCLFDKELYCGSLFDVISSLYDSTLTSVGCKYHRIALTKQIVKFYLITRLHFYIKTVNNSRINNKRDKLKHLKIRRCK